MVQLCLFTALRSEARQPEARPRPICVTRLSCVCLGVTSFDYLFRFVLVLFVFLFFVFFFFVCFLVFYHYFLFLFLCWAGDKLKSMRVKHGKSFQSKT